MIVGIIILVFAILIAVVWARSINHIYENYPDYKGEDWMTWEDKDENKNHTEGDF
jgi:Na+/citrate or Na+/malate symporter